jgi:hypothetical protein
MRIVRTSIARQSLLSLILTTALFGLPIHAAAQEPQTSANPRGGVWSEKIGFELSGFALSLGSRENGDKKRSTFRPGPSLFLRGPARRWGGLNWTTFEIGGGLFYNGGATKSITGFHAALGSELGYILFDNGGFEAIAGLGIGGGFLVNWVGDDYSSTNGGYGLIFSPMLGIRNKTAGKVTLGLIVRMLLPTIALEDYGSVLLVSLDIGIR